MLHAMSIDVFYYFLLLMEIICKKLFHNLGKQRWGPELCNTWCWLNIWQWFILRQAEEPIPSAFAKEHWTHLTPVMIFLVPCHK